MYSTEGKCTRERSKNHLTWKIFNLRFKGKGFPGGASGKKKPSCQYRRLKVTWVWSLGQEDPWKRKWQPTPVFLPGDSMGRGPWRATVHRVAKSWIWLKWLCKLQKKERGGQKSHFQACKRIVFSNDTKGHYEQRGDRFWFNIWTNTDSTPQENSTPSGCLQPEAGWHFWRCHGRNFIETLDHRP